MSLPAAAVLPPSTLATAHPCRSSQSKKDFGRLPAYPCYPEVLPLPGMGITAEIIGPPRNVSSHPHLTHIPGAIQIQR
ncbi:unnamed protein product [Gongylonema pulchrum]|uniref:Secreted protein n=1 Tax=Gongylonema pulchrum TaxID=637853 RepID=A0A183D7X7_9BILA|nr:unnamed protein product [Gongylonema pulchrum]